MRKLTLLSMTALAAGSLLAPIAVSAAELPSVTVQPFGGKGLAIGVIVGGNCDSVTLPDISELLPPGFNCPDFNFPGGSLPELPDIPDIEIPDTDTPDTDAPAPELPDTDKPGTDNPDTDVPVPEFPDTDKPDLDKPDGNLPDTDKPDTDTPDTTPPTEDGGSGNPDVSHVYMQRVIELVNKERAKYNLAPLFLDQNMEKAALVRAKEIQKSFSHTRPNGSGFYTALKEAGVSYRQSGENIAWGQKTPEEVVNAWMNSSGHRANILSADFSRIGVGYLTNASGTPYWVQLFAN